MLRHPRPGVTFFVQCGCDVVLVRFKAGLGAAPSTLRVLFVEGAVSRGGDCIVLKLVDSKKQKSTK